MDKTEREILDEKFKRLEQNEENWKDRAFNDREDDCPDVTLENKKRWL